MKKIPLFEKPIVWKGTWEELVSKPYKFHKEQLITYTCIDCGREATYKFYNIASKARHLENEPDLRCSDCQCKHSNLLKYGVANPAQSPEIKDLKRKNSEKKYGTSNPAQSEEVKDKIRKTRSLQSTHPSGWHRSKESIEKARQTCLKKYGVENVSQIKEVKQKRENTFKERYHGAINPGQVEEFRKKAIDTLFQRTGYENPNKDPEVRKKIEKTCIEKYGTSCSLHNEEIHKKTLATWKDKYGSDSPNKFPEVQEKIRKGIWNYSLGQIFSGDRLRGEAIPLFKPEDYQGSSWKIKYPFECPICHTKFKSVLADGIIPVCPTCHPPLKGTSQGELEVTDFIGSLIPEKEIETKNRTILDGQELDIYIPPKNLAIEYDGIRYHSSLYGKQKNYHLNKTKACESQNIRLIHIWDIEWNDKKEIVKSFIKSALGFYDEIIDIKECEIRKVSESEASIFLNENHMQGYVPSKESLGIFYRDSLTAVASFRKLISPGFSWELVRFAVKRGYHIINGFDKLIETFLQSHKREGTLIAHSDRRLFTGNIYHKYFKELAPSDPIRYWTSNFKELFSEKEATNTLKKISHPDIPIEQQLVQAGYYEVYDCGYRRFALAL